MPLIKALQPDMPLQPAEKAELSISAHGSATRASTPGSAESGRLEEAVSAGPASGISSPKTVRGHYWLQHLRQFRNVIIHPQQSLS